MYIQDIETGNGGEWSKSAMLEAINRDRSDSWTPYDESDYLEGWDAWVEGEFYTRHAVPEYNT